MRQQCGMSLVQLMVVIALSTGLMLSLFRLFNHIKMTEQSIRQFAATDNHGRYLTLYFRRWFKQWHFKFKARIADVSTKPDFITGKLQSNSAILLVKRSTTRGLNLPWTAIYVRSRPSGSHALYIQKQGERAQQLQDHVEHMRACLWRANGYCRQSVDNPVGMHVVWSLSTAIDGDRLTSTHALSSQNFTQNHRFLPSKWPIDIEINHDY
jgi:hypothetical protein